MLAKVFFIRRFLEDSQNNPQMKNTFAHTNTFSTVVIEIHWKTLSFLLGKKFETKRLLLGLQEKVSSVSNNNLLISTSTYGQNGKRGDVIANMRIAIEQNHCSLKVSMSDTSTLRKAFAVEPCYKAHNFNEALTYFSNDINSLIQKF